MNWKQAFALGLCSVGAYAEQKEPVAYLYNGVKLPPLPEWDKTKYPYAYIALHTGRQYARLVCMSVEPVTTSSGSSEYTGANPRGEDIEYLVAEVRVTDASWWELTRLTGTPNCDLERLLWTNYDVLRTDGTVYLFASDPIPVYE